MASTKPVVSIVVPCLNGWEYTKNLLYSVDKYVGVPYETIIVDSGSSEATKKNYKRHGLTVVPYRSDRFSYLSALATGIAVARSDIFVLANNDTVVGSRQFGAALAEAFARNPTIGIISPMVVNPHTRIMRTTAFVEPATGHCCGCMFAISRACYQAIGGFSDAYYGYGCEETDVTLRAMRARFRHVGMPTWKVAHTGGATYGGVATEAMKIENVEQFAEIWRYNLGFDPRNCDNLWARWNSYDQHVYHYEEQILQARTRLAGEPLFGIGISTMNRRWLLEEVVDGVLWTTKGMNCEYYISDDGSVDGTVHYLRSTGIPFSSIPIRSTAHTKNRILRYLLNRGCDYIMIVEDDTIPTKWGWPYMYAAAMEDTPNRHYNYMEGYNGIRYSIGPYRILKAEHVMAQVMAMTRDCVETVGAMDPRFAGYGYEHVDWSERAVRAGLYEWGAHLENLNGYFDRREWGRPSTPRLFIEDDMTANAQVWRDNTAREVVYIDWPEGLDDTLLEVRTR